MAEKFTTEKFMAEKVMVQEFMVERSGVKGWHWKVRGWNVLQLYEKHSICNGRKRKFLFKIENFKSDVYEWKIGANGHDVVEKNNFGHTLSYEKGKICQWKLSGYELWYWRKDIWPPRFNR